MTETGYRGSPWIAKGAFIQLNKGLLGVVPNIVVFQYNPETLSRGFTAWEPTEDDSVKLPALTAQNAQPFDLEETFDMDIELDATDALAEGKTTARTFGIADRIAALKQLMIPTTGKGQVKIKAEEATNKANAAAPKFKTMHRATIAPVLFVWGTGRIVPVRITSLSVEESQFSPFLYPTQATVSISLTVLTPDKIGSQDTLPNKIAKKAYATQKAQDEALAGLNLYNVARSMLPF